jgi:tRNA dimethylallyltransferase
MPIELVCLVGPTGVGKTAVAIELAEQLSGELVSADAVAVYRGLDIGSAKPTQAEQARARFHLIDVVDPEEDFSMADFARLAEAAFAEIRSRGKLPILVGGTGLYVRSVTATLSVPAVPSQPELRARLWAEVEASGACVLFERLKKIDPESKILANDAKKIIRALEVYEVTQRPLSDFHTPEGVRGIPKPDTLMIGLDRDRADLYQRIEQRIDAMLAEGLADEVRKLLQMGVSENAKSLGSLGYRHLVQLERGRWTHTEMLEDLKRETRRYAKRQLTWFRRDPAVRWEFIGSGETARDVAVRIINTIRIVRNSE